MILRRACLDTVNPPGQIVNPVWPFPSKNVPKVASVSNQEKALIHSINEFLYGLNAEEKRNDDDYNWVE
jgi:hypothetical protein